MIQLGEIIFGGTMKSFLVIFALSCVSLSAFANSRYFFDVLKIKALLADRGIENKFVTGPSGQSVVNWPIENIQLVSIVGKDIVYSMQSNNCQLTVHLTWDDDDSYIDPKYRVMSVGNWVCK